VFHRAVCRRCLRPTVVCYCAHIVPIETRTRVLLLQHPRERDVAIGTARMAELCLPRAELRLGIDFSTDPVVTRALADPERPAVVLFPGPDARDVRVHPPDGPVTLVVLDGTWWQAAKLLKVNPALRALPRYRFSPDRPSRYRLRREPAAHCLATIEALAGVLGVLEDDPARCAALLAPFDAMVEQQLAFAARSEGTRHRRLPRSLRPSRVSALLRALADRLVIGYGEANAWPSRTPGAPPPEVIHWLALRPATGERFEAIVAPRTPLAPSFTHHTSLSRERALAGEPLGAFRSRWQAFLRPDDRLACWGFFAPELLAGAGITPPDRLDLRAATIQHLGDNPGALPSVVSRLGAQVDPPWAAGRAGTRIAQISAIARAIAGW